MSALKARVMLVDDHAMLRHGMAMLINLEPDMEVSGEAGDGEEALAAFKAGVCGTRFAGRCAWLRDEAGTR